MERKPKSDIQVSDKREGHEFGEYRQTGGPQGRPRTGGNGCRKSFEFCPRPDMRIDQE